MADARAGIDIIVTEAGADQLLHQEGLFVCASRRSYATDGVLAVCPLDAFELGRCIADRLVPAHFLPRFGDLGSDHRLEDALLMRGVTPGEAALHAGMAAVRLAV